MSLLDQLIAPRLRDYWVRLALRRVHYTDWADKLDRLYMVEDPWRLQSAKEQARFAWTNHLIAAQFGRPETILEIGCGEGHQSQYLTQACDRLYGIDVSPRAVRRARRRCAEARFAAGDPVAFHFTGVPLPVDLVVACEVIYYVKDVPRFIERLSQLGRASGDVLPGAAAGARPSFRKLARLPTRTVSLRRHRVECRVVEKQRSIEFH
jgi:cyclopropane fatty-acyl-phospholipid synthase-like methyltransferase